MELQSRSQWRSFSSYVAVTTGAVIGLGNIFQFPFLAAKYGALFLIFYFLCQLLIGLPLLFAELLIGRRGKQNPIGSIGILTLEADANPHWRILGRFCVLIAFLTMCYYTVSAAFPVGYFMSSITAFFNPTNDLSGLSLSTVQISSFSHLELCFIIFLMFAMVVVYRGINRGLEELSLVVVPFYCLSLLALAIYLSMQGYFSDTVQSLVAFHKEFPLFEVFFAALTFAFLKYGTGMGVMIVYGSYLPYHVPLAKSTLVVIAIDALVSIMAYFIVYPLLLSATTHGNFAELSSHNVITIFSAIPHGLLLSAFFFFVAILIAWTPIIAMAETIVVTLIERLGMTRRIASIMTTVAVFLIGTFIVGTHMDWAELIVFGDYHLHNLLKDITMNFLAPTAALFIAIFAGWVMTRNATEGELCFKPFFYALWRFLIRYVIPVAILLVLVIHLF